MVLKHLGRYGKMETVNGVFSPSLYSPLETNTRQAQQPLYGAAISGWLPLTAEMEASQNRPAPSRGNGITSSPISATAQVDSLKNYNSSCSRPVVIYQNYSRGAELLPSKIVASESDLYMRRLWGKPEEFSKNWTIVLFHYDGHTSEWEQYDWARQVIHISARKQSKWWFAKRFLHPDVVAPYEYIFIWDEDLGVDNFDAEIYIELVKKYSLEISQPALEPSHKVTWRMTMRLKNSEIHRVTTESSGRCKDPNKPPCRGFVEIMAPVFSRNAWKCVWNLIQNDLIHGWGLDFALGRCVKPAYEKVGVVDAQWIVHKLLPSLGSQGESINGKAPWEGVRDRCQYEWNLFHKRLEEADQEALKESKGH